MDLNLCQILQEEATLPADNLRVDFQHPEPEGVYLSCSHHLVCGPLLWQPQETNAPQKKTCLFTAFQSKVSQLNSFSGQTLPYHQHLPYIHTEDMAGMSVYKESTRRISEIIYRMNTSQIFGNLQKLLRLMFQQQSINQYVD